ncbi:MAG: SLAC1 anion channel family protein [Candidatus Moraniibacteriota bacterium]
MKSSTDRLSDFPVSFFSVTMGIAGLALAAASAEELLGFPFGSDVLGFVAFVVFMATTLAYAMKLSRFPAQVRAEFDDPVRLHFFFTFPIGLILLSSAFIDLSFETAVAFWTVGTVVDLVLTFAIVSIWIRNDKFHPDHLNPSWFLPVVGNILIPMAGAWIFPGSHLWFFFGIGIIFWMILVTLLFDRTIFHKAMSERLVPTFLIMIAPPAVGVLSYLALTGSVDPFAYILYFFSLFLALLFFANLPMFTRIRFSLSWWAYSFPLSALSVASAELAIRTGEGYFKSLSLIVFAVAVIVIANISIRTIIHIRKEGVRSIEN